MVSVPSFSDKDWKIERKERSNRFSSGKPCGEPKRLSLTRQSSHHRLTNKENLILVTEQDMLMRKGVKWERGRSRQKIKIFSMM